MKMNVILDLFPIYMQIKLFLRKKKLRINLTVNIFLKLYKMYHVCLKKKVSLSFFKINIFFNIFQKLLNYELFPINLPYIFRIFLTAQYILRTFFWILPTSCFNKTYSNFQIKPWSFSKIKFLLN